jgi:hypothetical protein
MHMRKRGCHRNAGWLLRNFCRDLRYDDKRDDGVQSSRDMSH